MSAADAHPPHFVPALGSDWLTPLYLMQVAALSFRWFDGDETTGANLRGELPALIAAAGFHDVVETEHRMTPLGTLTYLRARTV